MNLIILYELVLVKGLNTVCLKIEPTRQKIIFKTKFAGRISDQRPY